MMYTDTVSSTDHGPARHAIGLYRGLRHRNVVVVIWEKVLNYVGRGKGSNLFLKFSMDLTKVVFKIRALLKCKFE